MKKQYIIVTLIIFIALSGAFYVLKLYMPTYHFIALETGNGIMAILSLSSYFIVKKQMDSRAQAFVRGVYSASFLKLMVCMVAILVYVLINRTHIHKESVFILFGIYAVYTVAETLLLSKLARE